MSTTLDQVAALARRLPGPSRRELLELAAFATALAACGGKRKRAAPASAGGDAGVVATGLDPASYRALDAATARILPTIDGFPGAREAGVMTFIDRQLAIPPLTTVAPALVALGRGLDRQARARQRRDFAELEPVGQDEVLAALAQGAWPDPRLPQRGLFRVLHGLVLEGFLADPFHGGNQNGIGWRAIGFREPPLRRPGSAGGGHGH